MDALSALLLGLLALAAAVAALLYRRSRRLRQQMQELLKRVAADASARHELTRVQAAAEERSRIYNDLHDDIGAKLLDLIYTAERPAHADLARAILQDLRDVVTRSRGAPGSLHDVLADIRAETGQRLQSLSIALDWQQEGPESDPQMDNGQALHLFRIVREAVTNAVRHAEAKRLRVRVREQAGELILDVTDEGEGAAPRIGAGAGTVGMQSRAAELQGSIRWDPGTFGGTKVVLRFPLPR